MSSGAVVWEGPSLLNGEPVVAIVTGLTYASKNAKTGPMAQAWILHQTLTPVEAVNSGEDSAICGTCAHRSGTNIGRSCYVIWWLGPQRVHAAYRAGAYPRVEPHKVKLRDLTIRLGAYGDPAAVPAAVWLDLATISEGWTGYTHQWRTCDPALKGVLMASVDSLEERAEAQASGWRTFRVRTGEPEGDVVCPASDEGGHVATCADCRSCQGTATKARSIAILPHGQRVRWITKTGDRE